MSHGPQLLLVGAVAAVGVLHTIVPDHWLPITLIARQRGWSKAETAFAALRAAAGHVASTLLIGVAVWLAGAAAGLRFGHFVDMVSSLALIGFGGWISIAAWREQRRSRPHAHNHRDHRDHLHHHQSRHLDTEPPPDDDPLYAPLRGGAAVLTRHVHLHHHGRSREHAHWHDHAAATAHVIAVGPPPLHEHLHKTTGRTALLLVLGSSPMVEGIPAFFAAARYGAAQIGVMAAIFAISTIATYVVLCVSASAGLQHVRFAAVERYGEVLSGGVIALVGLAVWMWPIM